MSKFAFRLAGIALAFSGVLVSQPQLVSARQSSPDQAPTAPPARRTPRSPLHYALPRREYLCEGGARVVILLETNAARLMLNDHIYNLKQVESTSGTKYSDGSIVWSSNGEDGFLEDDSVPGKPQILAKDCHLQSTYPPVASGTVTGTVSYLERVALPGNTVIIVELQDVTLADAPAQTIARCKTTLGNRKAPIPFKLKFDPSKIEPKHTYAVEVRILVDKRLRFTNDTLYPVLTQGNPGKVDLILAPVDAAPSSKP